MSGRTRHGIEHLPEILPNERPRTVTSSTETNVNKILKSIQLRQAGRSLGDVADIVVEAAGDGGSRALVTLHMPLERAFPEIRQALEAALAGEGAGGKVEVQLATDIRAHGVQRNLKPLPGIRNIIAVASGKGGVGKSTVAANLALALAADGARVGLLDADIYGPSQPHMLGLAGSQPLSEDGKTMQPLAAHGLQVMSIGFLVDPDQPMAWRGPMVTSALNQLLRQTRWTDLDYLVVDMPPGTGDIQLTLSQQVPVSGAVIVTTPQDIAAIDARKGLAMFRKVSIPVLGVVENMSTHVCTACGHEEPIFGAGGGGKISADFDVPLLGQLPLAAQVREQTDSGKPTVVADPESPAALAFVAAARRMAAELATQGRDYASKFPNIVVEDS
jgi:ATP-binding protein involved in chromosome partitioning